MNLRMSLITGLAVVALPLAASATPVTIAPGEIGKAFQLLLPAGGVFEASTSGGYETLPDGTVVPADTELFLFDANWTAIVANDDAPGLAPHSLIFNATPTAGSDPGVYHLIVTMFNAFPQDQAGNPLFDQGVCGTAAQCGPAAGEAGVVFAGNWSNLGGWDGHGVDAIFDLNLTVNGVAMSGTPEALPTPEPTSLFLLGSGALGLVTKFRRRNKSASVSLRNRLAGSPGSHPGNA